MHDDAADRTGVDFVSGAFKRYINDTIRISRVRGVQKCAFYAHIFTIQSDYAYFQKYPTCVSDVPPFQPPDILEPIIGTWANRQRRGNSRGMRSRDVS